MSRAADNKIVHQFERTPAGQVKVLVKGGNDKASTQPLKVLLGLEEEDGKKDPKKEGEKDEILDP